MKRICLFQICFIFASISNSYPQTEIPAGEVFGIWSGENSPYHVIGDIFILPGKTLVIEAGVIVESDPNVDLIVEGRLRINGTRDSLVTLTASDTSKIWGGIEFHDKAEDDSRISFAKIEFALAGIFIDESIVGVDNCIIAHCKTGIFGFPREFEIARIDLTATEFFNNEIGFFTGGPFDSNLHGCNFHSNTLAGAVIGHLPGANFGGETVFEKCLFYRNNIGLIFELRFSEPHLNYCTITDNTSFEVIIREDVDSYVKGSIIWGDPMAFEEGIVIDHTRGEAFVSYSDVSKFEGVFSGEGNINADPKFSNPEIGDYSLQQDSPCIDAGPDGETDPDGTTADMGAIYFDQGTTGIDSYTDSDIPQKSKLFQNYPNPFNPQTTIPFSLSHSEHVVVEVYNIKGQLVKRLIHNVIGQGNHHTVWNGTNEYGQSVSAGTYIYRLKTPSSIQTKKLILLK